MQIRQELRRWADVYESSAENYFDFYSNVLGLIGMNPVEANITFLIDYEVAQTPYTDSYIPIIFDNVYQTNREKYMRMAAAVSAEYNPLYNVDANERYTDTRTPNLTTETYTTGSSSGTVKNNQTRTTTDNGGDYHDITDSKRDPYDGSGLRTDGQTDTHATGSRSSSESYSGEADTTSSTSSGSGTTTATGTETIEHTLRRYGNIGVTSSQSLITQELELSKKLNIFKVIEKDIAAKLFIQVW